MYEKRFFFSNFSESAKDLLLIGPLHQWIFYERKTKKKKKSKFNTRTTNAISLIHISKLATTKWQAIFQTTYNWFTCRMSFKLFKSTASLIIFPKAMKLTLTLTFSSLGHCFRTLLTVSILVQFHSNQNLFELCWEPKINFSWEIIQKWLDKSNLSNNQVNEKMSKFVDKHSMEMCKTFT